MLLSNCVICGKKKLTSTLRELINAELIFADEGSKYA